MKTLISITILFLPLFCKAQSAACADIKTEIDQFTKTKKTYSPWWKPIVLEKKDEKISMYFTIKTSSAYSGKGLTILLENGEVLDYKYVDVGVNVIGPQLEASALFHPSDEAIKAFINSPIKAFRLNIYDQNIKDGEKYQQYLLCLTSK
jgi:ABC-type cobalt transport system substrate-binding protein